MVTALCDLAYTIHQGTTHTPTAHYLSLSPCVLIVTMVTKHVWQSQDETESLHLSYFSFPLLSSPLPLSSPPLPLLPPTNGQVVVVLVLQYERRQGVRSSAILFLLWLAMVVYACLKLRTLISIARDEEVGESLVPTHVIHTIAGL